MFVVFEGRLIARGQLFANDGCMTKLLQPARELGAFLCCVGYDQPYCSRFALAFGAWKRVRDSLVSEQNLSRQNTSFQTCEHQIGDFDEKPPVGIVDVDVPSQLVGIRVF